MAYVPQQISVYLAAFAGSLAGMATSIGPVSSSTPGDYQFLAQVADAFAQSFDTEYGALNAGQEFQIELIAELCESVWSQRSVLPATTSTTPSSYTAECDALVALVVDGSTQVAAQTVPDGNIWTAYTPTFNTANNDGAIGNGTITGFYKVDGDTLYYSIEFDIGGTTNLGTGGFVFGLPTGFAPDNAKMIGFGVMLSSGAAVIALAVPPTYPIEQVAAADFGPPVGIGTLWGMSTGAGVVVDATNPAAFAAGDFIFMQGSVAL